MNDRKNSKNISLVLLWVLWGQFISASFFVRLIFPKIYRSLPMCSVLTTGF